MSLAGIAMSELGELQAAARELQRRRNHLRTASQKHDDLLASSSPDPQEVCEAELVIAKAKVGVAEAELDEAKAKLRVAQAQEDTPERQYEIAELKGEIAELKGEVALAELKEAAAQAKRDGDTERLKSLHGDIDAKRRAHDRLPGQLFPLSTCVRTPGSIRTSWN